MKYRKDPDAAFNKERKQQIFTNIIWDILPSYLLLGFVTLTWGSLFPPASAVDVIYLISLVASMAIVTGWTVFMLKSDMADLKRYVEPQTIIKGCLLLLLNSLALLILACCFICITP